MKSSKTIMILAVISSPYGGNFLSTMIGLGKRLADSGWKVVYLFDRNAESRYWFRQVKDLGYAVEIIDFTQCIRKVCGDLNVVVSKYNISFIYANFIDNSFLSIYNTFFNRKVKIISHIRSDFSNGNTKTSLKQRIKNFVVYHILSKKMILLSCVRRMAEKYPNRILYIENTLALDRLVDHDEVFSDWRSERLVQPDDIVIEIFGWSPLTKGVDVAADAVKLLYSRGYTTIKLAIICGLTNNISNMSCWLKEHSTCSGDEPFLIYLPPTSDVFHYHRSSDCFISASRSEGFPNAFLEAMSLGKKCIISDIKGTEWGSGYANVSVFKSTDARSCAEAILSSISNGVSVDNEAAEEIQNSYSLDKWIDKFFDLTGLTIK